MRELAHLMARRKRTESPWMGRNESRFVRRMVVVLRTTEPVKWTSFATHSRPENKLSGSLAESIGFEPTVAV